MMEREGNGISGKQENTSDDKQKQKQKQSWSRFKDPRVVRVSRAFGGKDRHSKVYTVRGLRDRRVRLSVPTAIQLYDLQDRLGLNQPSKVVDWLLNVAKHEIDGLPPLQFPILTPNHGFFIPSQSAKHPPSTSGRVFHHPPDPYNQHNPSSFSSLLSGATMAPFNSWDPSNLTLSQPPAQDLDNFTLASHPHLLLYQPGQPYFPGFQGLELSNSSTVQPVRPFRFNINEENEHKELHSS